MAGMKIGELASATGASNETLRFYESRGLVEPPSRTAAGYRMYPASTVSRVRFILRARKVGFTLAEIEELLGLRVEADRATCGEVKQIAEEKLVEIEARIRELQQMRDALKVVTDACCGGEEPATSCTILSALDSGAAAQEVLSAR